jgi:hypothetical protein
MRRKESETDPRHHRNHQWWHGWEGAPSPEKNATLGNLALFTRTPNLPLFFLGASPIVSYPRLSGPQKMVVTWDISGIPCFPHKIPSFPLGLVSCECSTPEGTKWIWRVPRAIGMPNKHLYRGIPYRGGIKRVRGGFWGGCFLFSP